LEYAQAATTNSVIANLEAQAQDAAPVTKSPTPVESTEEPVPAHTDGRNGADDVEEEDEEEDMAEESDDVRRDILMSFHTVNANVFSRILNSFLSPVVIHWITGEATSSNDLSCN
jgi:hypothetical protein